VTGPSTNHDSANVVDRREVHELNETATGTDEASNISNTTDTISGVQQSSSTPVSGDHYPSSAVTSALLSGGSTSTQDTNSLQSDVEASMTPTTTCIGSAAGGHCDTPVLTTNLRGDGEHMAISEASMDVPSPDEMTTSIMTHAQQSSQLASLAPTLVTTTYPSPSYSNTSLPANSSLASNSSVHSVTPTTTMSTTTALAGSTHAIIPPPLPVPATSGGESIYRTIMNRLTALEANHTLYARYVEEQAAVVREALRRLGEDIGRLEGIVRVFYAFSQFLPRLMDSIQGKAQAQMYQRTVQEWERQRRRFELEHGELISRVNYLADEVRNRIASTLIMLSNTLRTRLCSRNGSVSLSSVSYLSFSSSWRSRVAREAKYPCQWSSRLSTDP
jgi:hypothetical protein